MADGRRLTGINRQLNSSLDWRTEDYRRTSTNKRTEWYIEGAGRQIDGYKDDMADRRTDDYRHAAINKITKVVYRW